MYHGGAISWRSKRQDCVALSTVESEYVAASAASQEAIFLRRLLAEVDEDFPGDEAVTLYVDNQGAMFVGNAVSYSGRLKHIDVRHHFLQEQVKNGAIKMEYVPSADNTADILTKPLNEPRFVQLRDKMGMVIL
jgi:hypothetical protein